MDCGEEVDERVAPNQVDELAEAGPGAGLLALAQPALRRGLVELVLVIDAMGHAVAAHEHVEP